MTVDVTYSGMEHQQRRVLGLGRDVDMAYWYLVKDLLYTADTIPEVGCNLLLVLLVPAGFLQVSS